MNDLGDDKLANALIGKRLVGVRLLGILFLGAGFCAAFVSLFDLVLCLDRTSTVGFADFLLALVVMATLFGLRSLVSAVLKLDARLASLEDRPQ